MSKPLSWLRRTFKASFFKGIYGDFKPEALVTEPLNHVLTPALAEGEHGFHIAIRRGHQ
jgi:hypothetical protein